MINWNIIYLCVPIFTKAMHRAFFIYSIFLLSLNELFAQKPIAEETSYAVISKQIKNELLNKATKEIDRKEYDKANRSFSKLNYAALLSIDSLNPKTNYAYAISLYSNFQQPKSISYFERALRYSKDSINEAYYFLGNVYHLSGNYNKAEQNYKIFLSLLERKHSVLSKAMEANAKKDILHRIEMCENAKRLSLSSAPRSLLLEEGKKISISYIGTDINTLKDDYGTVFSANDSIMFFTSKQKDNGDIYFSRFENNNWSSAEKIGWPINTASYEAVLNSSPDGKRIYFYRSGINEGTVYYSDFQDNHWVFPTPLITEKEAKTAFKETNIYSYALTSNKDELFIISDRRGGLGGKDIYASKKMADSTWGPLENLGATINTEYDEVALSLSPDGNTMYFSSNGNNSIGGFDVFVSNRKNGKWSQPINLGVPINTPGDDLFFSFMHNSNRATYSSSAYAGNSGRDLDVYYVDFCDDVKENTIKGLAIGFTKGTITVSDAYANGLINKCIIKDGKYSMKLKAGKSYDFVIETEGIQPVQAAFTLPEPKECKQYDIYQEISYTKPGDTLKIKSALLNIDYEKNNPDISSYSALLKKEDKRKLKNYSESSWLTYPPKTTTITSVVYDSTSGKELSKVTLDNKIFDIDKSKMKENYEKQIVKASAGVSGKEVTTFSFNNILFDFDKSKINENYKTELDKAVEFLNRVKPDSKIEVGGYTDAKGHRKHNLDLSKRRANVVANYLMSKKINRKRITIVGYGESKPIAPNKNEDGTDNSEGRAKNRRTEIVIK